MFIRLLDWIIYLLCVQIAIEEDARAATDDQIPVLSHLTL